MSYHISNLGDYAGDPADHTAPAYYADKDGFVPQWGDACESFTDPSGQPYDPAWVGPDGATWKEWIAAAGAATTRATRRAAQNT